MGYLEHILAATKSSQARSKGSQSTLTSMLDYLEKEQSAKKAAQAPVGLAQAAARQIAGGGGGSDQVDRAGNRGSFNPQFESALNQLIAGSGGRLNIKSGYRSPERQAQLYEAALKKYGSPERARKWVAPPGKSNHGRGLAADLGGDLAYAHANAARYGLAFPLANENWHIESRGARR